MHGYWKDPSATSSRFPRHPDTGESVLFTGDYGSLDSNRRFRFIGRRDDIYKQGSVRVSCAEVEAAANSLAMVNASTVVPPTGDRGSVLYVVATCNERELRAAILEVLEPGKVPDHIISVEAIPLTNNGKVDRNTLRARFDE